MLTILGIPQEKADSITLLRGRGCEKCSYSGYKGRTAIHEIMVINEQIRTLVLDREPASLIKRKARESGMHTLREDGFEKVLLGQTTVEEVMRVTQMDAG